VGKKLKIALLVIGILLILNGVGNIIDDSRVLTYDITSILSGIGFILASRLTTR
jgi:ABC-type transport system involved in multi-copper enzyme maturation permease subunit